MITNNKKHLYEKKDYCDICGFYMNLRNATINNKHVLICNECLTNQFEFALKGIKPKLSYWKVRS